MKQQLNLLFLAFQFYSRIPTGKTDYSEENLTKAFRYFPLVGIVVGGLAGCVGWAAAFIFPLSASIVLSLIAMVLLTGGLHEDGFSDFFDGFGGGYTKERILAIMKDSTVGAYGVISLILLFLLKFSLLLSLDIAVLPFVLIAAHASSRFMSIVLINTSRYARTENSKAMHTRNKTGMTTTLIAFVFAALPLPFLPWQISAVVFPTFFAIYWALKRYVERKINGFTGDILGALQQLCELAFYMIYVGFISYI